MTRGTKKAVVGTTEVVIAARDYFADPAAATRTAESTGRVLVKDAAGATRLIINSHRVSEKLLDK